MALSTDEMFTKANFVKHLGMQLVRFGNGEAETLLAVRDEHLQQHGFVHAGVLTTMADHTAGVAGNSLLDPHEMVLTIEFKMNFLRPAISERLRCVSRVLRRGKTLVVAESEVFSITREAEKLVTKGTITLAVTGDS